VCVFPAGTVVPAQFTAQATVPGGKGYFQLVSGELAGPGVEAPKSLVSIFSSAIKAAVSAPAAAAGALGECVEYGALPFSGYLVVFELISFRLFSKLFKFVRHKCYSLLRKQSKLVP
jgi:hypothetical protein